MQIQIYFYDTKLLIIADFEGASSYLLIFSGPMPWQQIVNIILIYI